MEASSVTKSRLDRRRPHREWPDHARPTRPCTRPSGQVWGAAGRDRRRRVRCVAPRTRRRPGRAVVGTRVRAERSVEDIAPPVDAFEPLTPDEVQIRRPIGEIFVELGFITDDQLEAALAAQSQSGARIGEILVEQGSLTRLDLASALFEQSSALQKHPAETSRRRPRDSELQQGVMPLRRTTDAGEKTIDPAAVGALDERLRLVESTASAAVSQADLDRAQIDLRAAIGALETRIEASLETAETQDLADALLPLLARVDALEDAPVQDDLAALRHEIEDLRDATRRGTAIRRIDGGRRTSRAEDDPRRGDRGAGRRDRRSDSPPGWACRCR